MVHEMLPMSGRNMIFSAGVRPDWVQAVRANLFKQWPGGNVCCSDEKKRYETDAEIYFGT